MYARKQTCDKCTLDRPTACTSCRNRSTHGRRGGSLSPSCRVHFSRAKKKNRPGWFVTCAPKKRQFGARTKRDPNISHPQPANQSACRRPHSQLNGVRVWLDVKTNNGIIALIRHPAVDAWSSVSTQTLRSLVRTGPYGCHDTSRPVSTHRT